MNSGSRTLDIIRIHERNCSAGDLKGCAAVETGDEEEHILCACDERIVVEATQAEEGDEEGGGGGWKKVESRRMGTQTEGDESRGKDARGKWILRMHRLSGMIPRANRYRLPHRKADGRTQHRASPVGTGGGTRRPRVCSPGRPEKWISWGAPAARSFFRGRASLFGAPPSTEDLSTSTNAIHRYISASLRIIRKYDYRNPRTSRLTVPSWWIAQSNRMSIVNPRAPPPAFPSDSRNVNEHYRAVYVTTALYSMAQFFFIKPQFFTIAKATREVISEKQQAEMQCCVFSMKASMKYVEWSRWILNAQ